MAKKADDYSHLPPRLRPGPHPLVVVGGKCPNTGKVLKFGDCRGCKFYLDTGHPMPTGDTVLCSHPRQPESWQEYLDSLKAPVQTTLF